MLRGICKRFLSLILVTGMIVTMLPFGNPDKVYAAGDINTGISGLSAAYDNGTWSISGNTIIGSVVTTSSTSCGSTTYTPMTGTITFTNTSSAEAIFSYTVTKTSGVGSVTDSGNGQALLQSGETVTVSASSSNSSEDTTTVHIVLNSFAPAGNVEVTFLPTNHGSYTVDGTKITASSVVSKKSSEAFVLASTANSGYKFFGWHDVTNDRYLSMSASASIYISSSISVEPVFIPQTTAVFDTNGHYFTDLNEAIGYAQTNKIAKVTLVSSGTLPAGNYTIPNGITLLIPFDNDQTMYKDAPTVLYNTYTTPSAFRILTMAPNANIAVASGGSISLSGNLSAKGQMGGYNGTPTGPDGRINMLEGSNITVQSGGNLYVWGYIYGSGSIEAMSGATVYEAFQIKDWRGGTATSSINSYAFIFNQYYVQNIEVPLKLNYGATEKLYSSANASSSAYPIGATYIGTNGMFNLKNGYIIKDYEESTDRNSFVIHGDMSVSPLTISNLPLIGSITTKDYVLPITSNITIDIQSGTTSLAQNVSFLPGVEMYVREGAIFEVSSNYSVYAYDSTEWLAYKFTGTNNLYPVGYSVANGTKAIRNVSSLKDVLIDVNGRVDAKGNFLTSENGANITSSSGTGEVLLSKAPTTGSITLYEMHNNKDKTAVPFYATKLHNGDDSYTATAGESAGTVFFYCDIHDKWEKGNRYVLTYDSNYPDGSSSDMVTQNICSEEFTLKANTFTFAGRTFKEWNTKADGSGTAYADQAKAQFSADTTLYAQWRDHEYGEPVWTWADDYSSATAAFVCVDGDDTQVIDAVITSVTTDPTCEAAGKTVYTATVTFEGNTYNDTKEVTIPATGHEYELSGWTWSDDYSSATASFTCKNNETHVETVNATVTSVTTDPTCESAGKTIYTATVTFEGNTYTDTKEISIYATGHDYELTGWVWTNDYSSASASFTCKECNDAQTINAVITSVTTDPTCEAAGKTIYTATVTFEGNTYTDTKEISISATGHDYEPTGWTWASDYSSASAAFTCTVCGDVQTLEASVTSETTPATCEEAGKTIYTATVTFEGKEYSDVIEVSIPATGHDYQFTGWVWSEDYASASATFTCKNDETHVETVSANVASETTSATCEEAGKTVYTATATFEGKEYSDTKEVSIPALGHDWDAPSYVWSTDNSSVTAKRVCKNDKSHIETETVNTSYEIVTEPSDDESGTGRYTAVFTSSAFETQIKDVMIAPLGHHYGEPVWNWAQDHTSANAEFICEDCGDVQIVNAMITSVTTPATCEEDGKTVYTATVAFNGQTYTDTEEVIIPATGHEYELSGWTWSDDYSSATASFTCKNDETHVETVNTNVTSVTTDPTCESAGKTVYTATVTFEGKEYSDTKEAILPALDHDWDTPSYTWADDNSSVTAKRVCKNDETHTETETVDTSYEVTAEPTCEDDGVRTYTSASFSNTAFTVQTKEVAIPALGHDYQFTGWVWSEDYTSATALFTCSHDVLHVQTLEAEVTSETTPATCETAGKIVYTATVTFEGKDYSNTKEVSIPALGHDYELTEWIWNEDYSKASAVFTCKNDESHTETITVEATVKEDEASFTYTVSVTFEGKEYTDTKVVEKTPEESPVTRIFGSNRYETSITAAKYLRELLIKEGKIEDQFNTVVLAYGEGFADALAGSYLANKHKAPILLINEKRADEVKEYIRSSLKKGGTVYVLGGEAGIGEDLISDLEGDYDVKRLWGDTRYDTNLAILKEAGFSGGEILVCAGRIYKKDSSGNFILDKNGKKIDTAYADSLSASSTGLPVLLINSEKGILTEEQKKYLADIPGEIHFRVIGGTAAIPEETAALLKEYGTYEEGEDRIAGSNRYATSVLIAEEFFPEADKAVLAYGEAFPDGLSGGTIAYHLHSPLLLSISEKDLDGKNTVNKRKRAVDYASSHNIRQGIVLGGPVLINDESVSLIFNTDISDISVYTPE